MNVKKIVALIVVVASGCAALAHSAPSASLTANPVYEKNCARCHGKTAEGRFLHGPSLISAKVASATTEDLSTIIANGKGHMPKFKDKLTPERIETLVQQIEAGNKK
jgi:cytochrome c551